MIGAGASHMHNGIPHLHSMAVTVECCCSVFESASAWMSNLETSSATLLTAFGKAFESTFPDLHQNRVQENNFSEKWNRSSNKNENWKMKGTGVQSTTESNLK